ncbi:hypothetical protein RZS08_16580, partial [Arthrospira platensis SPKY1]|nr:hypothetical protein [Arthrospira platensis SPKY1]
RFDLHAHVHEQGRLQPGGGASFGLGLQAGPGFEGRQVLHGAVLSVMPRPVSLRPQPDSR